MHVAGLPHYPVKSLAGEALMAAQLTGNGIGGARVVHIAGNAFSAMSSAPQMLSRPVGSTGRLVPPGVGGRLVCGASTQRRTATPGSGDVE